MLGLSDKLNQGDRSGNPLLNSTQFEGSRSAERKPPPFILKDRLEASREGIKKYSPSVFPTRNPNKPREGTLSGEIHNVFSRPVKLDTLKEKLKTKFVVQNGRLKVKAENPDGSEVEIDTASAADVEKKLAQNDIKFASGAGNQIILKHGTTSAEAKFPLSYDPSTNQVLLTTPNGDKVVKVMPEQALKGLMNSNVLNKFDASQSGMMLNDKNGNPVYIVRGKQSKKLFSFIPVTINKEVEISAETGEVVSQNLSFGSQVLNLISN